MTRHTDQLITDTFHKSIQRQIAELTARLEKSNELLNRFVATEEIKMQEGRIESEAQEEDYKEAAAFLNKYYGKKYDV